MINGQIKFGTDGWRSVIADGFTYNNLKRVTQATCDVLKKESRSRLIVVGYDHRFLSEEFALTASSVALANGFKVELSKEPVTSPTLSFQTKLRKAAVGIMITASHNPAHFSGFKLKGPHGGSVNPEFTKKVEEQLDAQDVQVSDKEPKRVDFVSAYLKGLKKNIKQLSLGKIKGPVVFDAMHGPGGKLFEKLIGSKGKNLIIREEANPLFGGTNPEPIESNLSLLKETVVRKKASIGLAVDGDADRIGLIDNKGNYIPPHTVMPLILEHLIVNRKLKGAVVQTVSMGYLPERLAKEYKLPHEEVSVGYKHVAQRMGEKKVLFGGEESGGFGVGLWSAERDGLLCSLLLLEYLSKSKKSLSDLIHQLHEKYGASHFKRIDFPVNSPVEKEAWTQRLASHVGAKISGHPVKEVKTLDGLKVILEDDSWVLIRPSGTEPLIRTYSEGSTNKVVKELLSEAERLVQLPPPRAPRGSGKREKKDRKNKRPALR